MDAWLNLAKGPIFQFSFLFMVLGLLRHVVVAVVGTAGALRRANNKELPVKAMLQSTLGWLVPVDKVRTDPFFSVISIVMHAGLIVVPAFLLAHVALFERGVGLSWPALPMGAADGLTLATIAALFALFALRIISRNARGLSRFEDYALLLLLAVPFVSGYLAAHPATNPFDYKATMLVHVLGADLLFVLMPLTKLSHAVLMPGTQLAAEVAWHFPADSGRKVAATLDKEDKPI